MDLDKIISSDAWVEFEEIINRHINGGDYYLEKDLAIFADRHSWHDLLCTDDKLEFQRRARVCRRFEAGRQHWMQRKQQLLDSAKPFKVGKREVQRKWIYRSGPPVHCEAHRDFGGLVLSPDHPFWQAYFPPLGWMCGCRIAFGHTDGAIKRSKGRPEKRLPDWWDDTDPDTGRPFGIEVGFVGQTMPTLWDFFKTVVAETDYRWRPDIN
jgi:hypothetical protein